MCAGLVRGFAQACVSWLSAYFLQYPYNVFPLYTFLMAGSAVSLGVGWTSMQRLCLQTWNWRQGSTLILGLRGTLRN